MLPNNKRRVFTMTSGSQENPDIRAALDPTTANKINIHLGTTYISMSLDEWDDLAKAVYIAVNIDSAIKSAAPA